MKTTEIPQTCFNFSTKYYRENNRLPDPSEIWDHSATVIKAEIKKILKNNLDKNGSVKLGNLAELITQLKGLSQ